MNFKYFHLQNSKVQNVGCSDELSELSWFPNYLCSQFQSLCEVNSFVTADESMAKFKRRLDFQWYLLLKPAKWASKVWIMAESSTIYATNVTGCEGIQVKLARANIKLAQKRWPDFSFGRTPRLLRYLLTNDPLGKGSVKWKKRKCIQIKVVVPSMTFWPRGFADRLVR